MEFQTFEEKFQSIMEKWFTDTNKSMEKFYNKQQHAIDEGIELIFSDLRSSLNSNLTANNSSSDLEIQSDDKSDFGGLKTEIVKHQSKEIAPSVDSSSFIIHTSNGEQGITTNGGNRQVEDTISFKEEGNVISALIHDTGKIEYGGIDGKSDEGLEKATWEFGFDVP